MTKITWTETRDRGIQIRQIVFVFFAIVFFGIGDLGICRELFLVLESSVVVGMFLHVLLLGTNDPDVWNALTLTFVIFTLLANKSTALNVFKNVNGISVDQSLGQLTIKRR